MLQRPENMSAELLPITSNWQASTNKTTRTRTRILCSSIRASQSMDERDKAFKELGLFALRKKIEDAVVRAEMLAPTALELEEERRIQREEKMRDYNLWDDPVKSNEMLAKLADSAKVVDALKDLAYKIEEAKLITELAETDAVNYRLFKQAYTASVDASNFLDHYEMSKLLRGTYDMHGASIVIKTGEKGIYSEIWAERLLSMYIKWAKKLGHKGRVLEKSASTNGGIKSVTIEFEFQYAYGYLMGEKGVHCLMDSLDGSNVNEASLAAVDVIPLFLNTVSDISLDDEDLIISYESSCESENGLPVVHIQHVPTGIYVQSSGERNKFANKMKALNRLKAKLLVVMSEQGISSVSSIKQDAITNLWKLDARRYMLHPYKLVQDVKTSIQISDFNSVLNGNIDVLIGAHINLRHAGEKG